jgi:antitoxin (DNA-binding transcriptional repressor) of toxin-antitoxin stability system
MKATILDLRRRMGEVLKALDRNEPVTILYRGRPKGILYPMPGPKREERPITEEKIFGMWKDREDMKDVAAYVRRLRQGRLRRFGLLGNELAANSSARRRKD